jgi:hypothetical protein
MPPGRASGYDRGTLARDRRLQPVGGYELGDRIQYVLDSDPVIKTMIDSTI